MPTTVATYTNRPGTLGGPLSLRRSGQSRFVLADIQGHARQLTDSSGAVTDTLTADAWGVPKASSGSTVNPYKAWSQYGYFTDTPSRLYVRARHLRVDLGRWSSRDPILDLYRISNLYIYSDNRPLVQIDPSGKLDIQVSAPSLWRIGEFRNQNQLLQCCGKYAAYWKFVFQCGSLPSVAPCDGFIVQHVKVDLSGLSRCPENPTGYPMPNKPDFFEYTEVWPQIAAGALGPPRQGEFGYDDRFTLGTQLGLGFPHWCGTIKQTGEAKYFCFENLLRRNALDARGKLRNFTKNCAGTYGWSGGLECLGGNAPAWFILASDDNLVSAVHSTSATFNCCGDDKTRWRHHSEAHPSIGDTTRPC